MKKIFLSFFGFILLSTPLCAQELIPLFDDMPSFEKEDKTSAQQPTVVSSSKSGSTVSNNQPVESEPQKNSDPTQPIIIKNKTEVMPRLGRNAEPLNSIVLAPFPGEDVSVDLDAFHPTNIDKQFEETGALTEEDILKRSSPLTVTEEGKSSIDVMIQTKLARAKTGKKNPLARHDVSAFELAGLSLGFTPDDVEDTLTQSGFKLVKVEQTLPDILRKSYENACHRDGVLTGDKIGLKECVAGYVHDMQTYYIKRVIYERAQLRERVIVDFTTPLTQNIAYRITYVSKGDHSLGSSRASMMEKQQRRNEFWQLMFDTYGLPDDADKLIWGDPENAYMRAAMIGSGCDAYIVLEDLLSFDNDYLKLQDVAQEEIETRESQFGFASKQMN